MMMDKVLEEDEQSYFKNQDSMLLQPISHHNPPSPPPTTTTSPPSSPTHEFSFTVSLHPNPPPPSTHYNSNNTYDDDDTNNYYNHKTNYTTTTTTTPHVLLPPPPLAAIDLSPADDIFFHGHLLPLHLLSHLPVSPRSSTNSMDSFTLPTNLLYDIGNTSFHCHHQTTFSEFDDQPEVTATTSDHQSRPKSKSFSIFSIPKWKKRCDDERERERDDQEQSRERNNHKKLKLDLGQLIKRYMKMVRPLLSFPKSRRSNNHQSYSFSGKSCKPPEMYRGGKRRGQFSAPASMRTSPANSGILVASGAVSPTKSTTSESTMEELHAAIQAAIAHCKNSIAMEDKIQSQT